MDERIREIFKKVHVQHESKDDKIFNIIQKSYNSYKKSFAKDIEFYQDWDKEVDISLWDYVIYDNAYVKEYPDLIFVEIFFDTATYDEIERDVKITMEAALGLIGGTMGLLTGFSILSGVEIIYYLVRF